jgi:type I restriction enzyme S subunit
MQVKPGSKQTEVGVIPEEWEVKSVKSLNFDISDGNYASKYPKASDFRLIGVPFIRANNVHDMGIVDDDMRFISKDQHRDLQKGHLKKNDILVTTRGDIGQIALVPDRHVGSNINAQIVRINTDNHGVDHRFFAYSLGSESSQAQLKNLQTGSALKQLPVGRFTQLQLAIPTPPEQRAIAGALSDADALIDALGRLIAKKRDLKQATMQQLLTGQTRLPGFHDEWDVRRLGNVFSISAGTSKSAYVVSGGRYWIVDMGSVSTDGRLIVSKGTNYQGDFLKIGDLVMPKDDIGGGNIIGKVGYIDADDTYVLGDHVYCLRAKEGHPLFLAYLINNYQTNTALRRKVIGSAQLGLVRKSVEEQEIPFPLPSEQTAIAEVLSDMDAELAALEQHRDKTRALKQGMMQELLTGRTRLV